MWKWVSGAFLQIALTISPVPAAAAGLIEGDAKDIDFLLRAASGENSAYMSEYIGSANGRSYIVYRSAVHAFSLLSNEMSHVVYGFPDEALSGQVVEKFLGYRKRWESLRARHESNKASQAEMP